MVWVANELQMTAEFREGCCKLPQMYPQHRKIRQGPTSSNDFHTIPNTFHPKYLQTKPYESMSMTVWIWFFSFCSPFCWAEGKIRHMNMLLSGWKTLWLNSRLTSHSTRRGICFCVHSPVAQHWLPKELPTVPSLTLLFTLSRGYFPLTIRKNSAVSYKMQVKRNVLVLRISVA